MAGVSSLIQSKTLQEIANEVARALITIGGDNDLARLSLPLLYPGGSTVTVEINRLRDGFLVTDAGTARREAGLLGGERTFIRLAGEIAERFGVRFDRNMFFEMEVSIDELVVVVSAIANAAKSAVESTAMHMAAVEHADARAVLWDRLGSIYGGKHIQRKVKVRGSSDSWEFDAAVQMKDRMSVFEIISPNANAVNSAVTKFLDVRDIGVNDPNRIAVVTRRDQTPHLPVLARTAVVIPIDAPNDAFLKAARQRQRYDIF